MNGHGNGNGKASLRAALIAGSLLLITWMTWVTVHVQNYVSGEARGERLSTVEAELMIRKAHEERDNALRREFKERGAEP